MAKHDEYIKYGLWAVGAYLVYTKVWPIVSSELSNLTSSATSFLTSSTGTVPASAIASEFNPSGLPSSTYYGITNPVSSNVVAGNASSPNINNGMAIYYITAQDSANISLMAPVGTTNLTFSNWARYYQQAKGISLPLSASDTGIDSSQQITLSQFTVLVNTHYPKPTLSGVYGLEFNNAWYGVT